MENIMNEFITYLFTIGLLSKETLTDLISSSQQAIETRKKTSNNNDLLESFKNNMTNALMSFLSNFTANKLKLLSLNIILKFIENHKAKQREKLRSALLLSSRITTGVIGSSFKRWHKQSHTHIKQHRNNLESLTSNSYSKKHNEITSHYHLETSRDTKEREDYEQCTFHPMTNRRNKSFKNEGNLTQSNDTSYKSVYERLYLDKDKYKLRKELLALQVDNSQSEHSPFVPKMIETPSKQRYRPNALFYDRQKSFESSKSKNRNRIIEKIESEINQNLTFNPQINKSFYSIQAKGYHHTPSGYSTLNQNTSIYIQPYDKSKRNKASVCNNDNENSCNSFHTPHNNRTVDYSKIEQLYTSYKSKKDKLLKIQKEMEEEQGVTFHPLFQNKDSSFHQRINTSFHERNEKFIQNKKAFVDQFLQTEIRLTKERQIGNRNYTKEEKEIIAQKIIERLYKQENKKIAVPPTVISTSFRHKEIQSNTGQMMHLDANIIEGLPSTDMIKTQSNEQNDSEKLNDIHKRLHISSQPNTNDGIQDNRSLNSNQMQEEEVIGKYNDKLISIDEYTFSKNKKAQKELASQNKELNDLQSEDINLPHELHKQIVYNPFKEE